MSLYLILDVAAVFFPVVLSFDRKVAYYRRWPAALLAAAVVAAPFLVWDALMTRAGAWGFSSRWAGEARIAGMPPAEILFFFAVPFSCLFVYDVVGAYFRDRAGPPRRIPWMVAAAALAVGAALLRSRLYTSTILGAAAIFLALTALLHPRLLASSRFWLALLLSYVPFLAMNGALTALPIVSYSPAAILGPRVITIPVEDFLYSFALLGLNLLVYDPLSRRMSAPTPPQGRARRGTPDAARGGRSAAGSAPPPDSSA